MADSIAGFVKALDRVPTVLLSADTARIISDARTSADVLDAIENSSLVVVVVGATGVGKSHLVNDLVGLVASEVSVLRPTTRRLVIAGTGEQADVGYASDFVLAQDAPDGLAIVDTPAPDTDTDAVSAALAVADIGVLVVSPSRYADAATHDLWSAMGSIRHRLVVLTRQRGTRGERAEVLASARERFADATVLEVDEGGSANDVRRFLIELSADQAPHDKNATIARIAASGAARHVASALTASAIELGTLRDALDKVRVPEISGEGLAVIDSWLPTERELVQSVNRSVIDLDQRTVTSVSGDLGRRMASSLGRWESGPLEEALSAWREKTAVEFRRSATIRWRRSSAERLLDQASWRVGVNPTVRVEPRVTRMMGSMFELVSTAVHTALVSILNDAIEDHSSRWRAAVEQAGSFKPGELLAAADAIEKR